MSRSALKALLLALALAPWAGRGLAAPSANPWNVILIDNDPRAAEAFLLDASAQARLKSEDEGYYRDVFARAVELKDLSDLLNGIDGEKIYRDGLARRSGCRFCQDPDEVMAWSRKYFGSMGRDRFISLERALFEWDALAPERLEWLKEQGETKPSWAKRSLSGRRDFLSPWALTRYEAFMKELPGDAAAAQAYEERAWQFCDLLDPTRLDALWERVEKAKSAVAGLAQARRLAARSGNPALKAELARASAAGDLDALLTGLNKVFDGAGKPSSQLRAQAPPRAGQVFDPASRDVVTELMKSGLRRELENTWAGDELESFYEKHPLDLHVGPMENPNAIGVHLGGKITFNEKFITEYLKGKGRDIRDLQSDPALLRELTAQLSSNFVHESTHYRQFAWAREHGIESSPGQNFEMEAMQTQALFVWEKLKRDPSYRAILVKSAPHSVLARESLSRASEFKNDPAHFRDVVKAYHYPELLSLEGRTWTGAFGARIDIRAYESELVRRRYLPAAEAASLEDGPALDENPPTWDDWRRSLKQAGSKHLRALLEQKGTELDRIHDSYEALRDRLDQVNRLVEERRLALLAEKGPAKTRRKADQVPSPVNP